MSVGKWHEVQALSASNSVVKSRGGNMDTECHTTGSFKMGPQCPRGLMWQG